MKFQKTGSDGIMDIVMPPKCDKGRKHTFSNDKIERKLTDDEVKETGNVLKTAKTSVTAHRLKSNSGKSVTTPQVKVKSSIKEDDQRKHDSKKTSAGDVHKNKIDNVKNKIFEERQLHKDKLLSKNKKLYTTDVGKSDQLKNKQKDKESSSKGEKSRGQEEVVIKKHNDSNVSSSKAINKVCQSSPNRQIVESDNRQSSDKEITHEVDETCKAAKDKSINCSGGTETFSKDKYSKDVSSKLFPTSDAQIKVIEQTKRKESGSTNLRCKNYVREQPSADRLHNIRSIGNNNSGEIDQLADGQNNPNDQKVQQNAPKQLSYLLDLNIKSEKDISYDHEESSANIVVYNQSEGNCQQYKLGNLSSADNEKCNESCTGLYQSENIVGTTGQCVNDHDCAISSSTVERSVPKAIINDNMMMGNDLQYMTSVPNSCRGFSESIQKNILDLGTNDSCNQDNNDSLTFINNGLSKSTESTDRNNRGISLPCTVCTEKNLHCDFTDTILGNKVCVKNTDQMENQNDCFSDTGSSLSDHGKQTDNNKVKDQTKVKGDKQVRRKTERKLLSPKISTKKFNSEIPNLVNSVKVKTLPKSDRSEKEKLNQENAKRKEKIPRTSTPTSNKSKPKCDGHRSSSKQSSIRTNDKKYPNNFTGVTAGLTPNKPIDIIKEWSPCSDVSNASSSGSYKGVRPKTTSFIRGKTYESSDKLVNTLTSQKQKNTSNISKTPVECCQSTRKSNRSFSSPKITNSKYTLSGKQLSTNKIISVGCPSAAQKTAENVKDREKSINYQTQSNVKTVRKSSTPSPNRKPKDKNLTLSEESLKSHIPIKADQDKTTPITMRPDSLPLHTTTQKNLLSSKGDASHKNTSKVNRVISPNEMKINAKHKTQRHSPSPTISLSSRASSIASLSDRKATQRRPVSCKTTYKSQNSNIPQTTNRHPSESSSGKINKIPIASRPKKIQASQMKDLKTPCSSKSCTPSPTLSRSSRSSSVVSPCTIKNQNLKIKQEITKKKLNISNSRKPELLQINKVPIRRSSLSSIKTVKVARTPDDDKIGKQMTTESKIQRTSKLPKSKLTQQTSVDCKKHRPQTTSTKHINESTFNKDKEEHKTNVKKAEDLLKQTDKKSHEEEHPICNKTSDINAETSNTVCLSDKPDHVPITDQIKEEPFDFCEAQNSNIVTNQQLQKQVQDPLMEIRSISNSKTITPMEFQQKPEVHSSVESVCSEQYWSASEGENEHDNLQLKDRVVPMILTNETMDSNKNKEILCDQHNDAAYSVADDECEKSHVQLSDNCALNTLPLESKTDLLHNYIDRTCTTENDLENSTDLMIENISQHWKYDHDTSERLINTFLPVDSEDFDKAQYVSKDYEENISQHSNLEQHLNAGNDKLSVEINEVNRCKFESKYNIDIAENAVKEVYVKTEKLSEPNIMEHLINKNSSKSEHLPEEAVVIYSEQQSEQQCEEECKWEISSKGHLYLESNSIEEDFASTYHSEGYFNNGLYLESSKGDFNTFDKTETYEVRTPSIQGNSQFETKTINQNEEVSRVRDELICENINLLKKDYIKEYDCPENKIYDRTITTFENVQLYCNPTLDESVLSNNVRSKEDLTLKDEIYSDKSFIDSTTELNETESEHSDSSMASSSVQNSPGTRRPRRQFSRAERKQKYEQLSLKSQQNSTVSSSTKNSRLDDCSHYSKGEVPVLHTNEIYQTSSSHKSETFDSAGRNISGTCYSESLNSKSRCTESSLINKSTVRLKYHTDESTNKHVEEKLNEEATFTKIITYEHDTTLSHSQSQDSELILVDKTALSSVKRSEDSEADASQGVVKRTLPVSNTTENRRAINLDKLFRSEEGFSISVECTLQLSEQVPKISKTECVHGKSDVHVSSVDVEETVQLCLRDDESLSGNETGVSLETLKTVSNEHVFDIGQVINSSPDTKYYQDKFMPSDTSMQDKNIFVDANYECTPSTSNFNMNISDKIQKEVGTSFSDDITSNEIKETEYDIEQKSSNFNKCEPQLESNLVLDNSNILHSSDTEHLKHEQKISNSPFAEMHEKFVICVANNAIPCIENDKSSKTCSDEASENHVENNVSQADRKHMTLDLPTNEKHNSEMGLTANVKVQKSRDRKNIRRLTDTILFDGHNEKNNATSTPKIKQRARSKSPVGCSHSRDMDSDQVHSHSGHGKVSEICSKFIQKTTPGIISVSPSDPGLACHLKAVSPSRHMKWARVEGVWQRVPVDDSFSPSSDVIPREVQNKASKPNRKSNETLFQWKNLYDKIQKVQQEKRDLEDENTIESHDDIHSLINNIDKTESRDTEIDSKISKTSKSKPKPPKTLPKPKRHTKSDHTTGAKVLSIIHPKGDNELNNVSSDGDNELTIMHKNEDGTRNKSKQVQKSVEDNKEREETICIQLISSEKEHEKHIREETFKSTATMSKITIDERIVECISFKKLDGDKIIEITKENEKNGIMQIDSPEADMVGIKESLSACKTQDRERPLENKYAEEKVKVQHMSNEKDQPVLIKSKLKHGPDTRKTASGCAENFNVFDGIPSFSIDNDGQMKQKTVPIKQEMFPKEEDISSDFIAKVLRVMDSFTTDNDQSSGVQFVVGNEDSKSDLHRDYRNTNVPHHDNDRSETGLFMYGQRQPKLLSEISELEERGNEDILEDTNKNITNRKAVNSPPCSTPSSINSRSPCLQRSSFSHRSHSLPTTALSHPGSRILYRNGSFIIEPDFPEEIDEDNETHSLDIENGNVNNSNTMGRDLIQDRTNYSKCKRSQSEADLCDVDDNLFLQNDGNLTVIENENADIPLHGAQTEHVDDSYTQHSPIEQNELVDTGVDNKRKTRLKKKSRLAARRSRSFKDFSETEKPIVALRRNLSFVEAIKYKENLNIQNRNGSLQSLNSTTSVEESPRHDRKMSLDDTRSKSQGFLQKVFARRKGSLDQGGKKKSSESKESILWKMSLKTLFGAKKTKEQSVEKVLCEEPPTPPIAAFQSDNDIHIMDSAPGSPYSSLRFKRRHTSAEIYDQSGTSSSRSSLDIVNHRSRSGRFDDQLSVKSFNSSNLSISEQPLRPKSPKPNVTIVRRNSNISLPSSPTNEVMFDMGGKLLESVHRKYDSIDATKIINGNNSNHYASADVPTHRPNKLSAIDLEKLASLVQNDMTSSNSNDSGIQHDVSVHSSNESLKANTDSSNVTRRRKSPSPRPERPKSEISVRWADLVETTDISPVKRRESGENRPRPKSDLGGSSLSPDMKPFGSQSSLQLMYSSLQSLDSLRKHDSYEQKPNKRRMSTPHPIKTRLSRVPPKQQKRVPLVRSHSMPESLDKLHRRKKLHSAIGSSNLHDIYLRHFDDDSSSDDGSDISVDHIVLNEKSLSARSSRAGLSTLDEMPESENRTYAEALWDHITMDQEELRFRAGDLLEIIDMNDKDWWYGALDDHQEGWLPATFVRLRVNQDHFEEDFIGRFSEIPEHTSPNLRRISMINPDQGRINVINEILQAEQDYVKHMKDVVEGYIRHARKRVDMFTEEKISVIFGNIEEIFKFSTQFLETLESAYCKEQPHQSELGKCFLKHSKGFEIYSDYCNNHPSGSAELKDLYRKQKYRHFFEACRLLQEMIEIPLEGFLLNPVQKICKYPLQLAELLKYTPQTHPDYVNIQQALEAMKKIAALINERKRKMESIEKLARWQHTVEDWQGKDLLERSSELIYSSEINKINSAGWSQERWFYLFDHQLVYCKKDLLKRNGFSYKGRIDIDECDIEDIEDGKDVQYNVTVKNAWKIHEVDKDKWYLLYAKTPAEKQRWLKAFQKERERVKEDQENNFMPDHWKNKILNRIKASQEKQNSRTQSEIQYKQEFIRGIPSHATLPRSYSKKQNKRRGWFPFGGKQKSKT
ncbi:uncharacterized protein LOC127698633 isoform X2 [Mytilus californianus]|uniref:uncharacterized protein LOC127698633 isoform X2 n=1 Tax=Mytilus californianus TaxID=6549 RepID=UPI002247B88C|nr:uncharacterized protein LOC127698633 isoform X2 [Mytilus californianus]